MAAATTKIGLTLLIIACHNEQGSFASIVVRIRQSQSTQPDSARLAKRVCIHSHVALVQMDANAPFRLPLMAKEGYLICPGYSGYDIYVTGH